jgi:hypothetical protein
MFEHVPTPQPALPTQPNPAAAAMANQGKPKPLTKPISQPPTSAIPVADHATMELFKRTSLGSGQKILIVVVAVVVILALVGAGIWLFMELDPFSATNRGPVTNTNDANIIVNSNIPLQELDTDKDGIRDIDEKRYGTSATSADTDADGLSDYVEVNQYHTSPTLLDTDGDGYNDKSELDNSYDPNGPGRLAE